VIKADAESIKLHMLPTLAVGPSDAVVLTCDGSLEHLTHDEAMLAATERPHIMVNTPMIARRLGLSQHEAYDVLELYAFTRPARYCLPTVSGLCAALMINIPVESIEDQAIAAAAVAKHLISELAAETYRYRAGATAVLTFMAKGNWLWGPIALKSAETYADHSREDGLSVWMTLPEWEDGPPSGPPGNESVNGDEAIAALTEMLGEDAEDRAEQKRYAQAATHAFSPTEMSDGPNTQLLEAGTGTGKTMGYIAPAALWAKKNGAPVWLSTFTKNLQRQIDQELSRVWPDPRIKAKKAVIRKGRENYACLLNMDETLRAVMSRAGGRDRVLMGLVLRWARYSRDGDMIGGDFPSWLGGHFGQGRISGLTDRRGECLYAACAHYRKCFIEKAVRKAKVADLVVANHALVMAQAANRPEDPERPQRIVFDEGHHVFDAADNAFSLRLSGMEGAELRRWLRGKEQGGSTRARGLKNRVEELISDDDEARQALDGVLHAARLLPADSWMARVAGMAPNGDFEAFLAKIRAHVMARADTRGAHSLETPVNDPIEGLIEAASRIAQMLNDLAAPMTHLAARLVAKLDEESDSLDSNERGRLEAAARSLVLRTDMVKHWASMASSTGGPVPENFVDWFEVERYGNSERDIGQHRHFIDPSKPFADVVLAPAKGVVITSATLRDKGGEEDDWSSADIRTGVQHLLTPTKRLSVRSPFDYAKNTRVIVVTDVNKQDPAQVASAYRELMLASGGGALGLFTAISRLRGVYNEIASTLEAAHIPLYAQHVDPIDTATLVDIFRDEEHATLLGTDAVRDGVDVPGTSLRMIVFDRTPWPRPTLLHRARRAAFGGKAYDEMLTRLKINQAFGRLIRTEEDKGVFIMLDAQTPSRLLSVLPEGVTVERVGLAEAITLTKNFLGT